MGGYPTTPRDLALKTLPNFRTVLTAEWVPAKPIGPKCAACDWAFRNLGMAKARAIQAPTPDSGQNRHTEGSEISLGLSPAEILFTAYDCCLQRNLLHRSSPTKMATSSRGGGGRQCYAPSVIR